MTITFLTKRPNNMQLDPQSEKELSQTLPGYGVIFVKVAEDDVRSTEFFYAFDGTIRTATFLPSSELHDWIETQYRELKEKRTGGE
jgi:hypothetical protein